MKKLISVFLLFAMMISCCACGGEAKQAAEETPKVVIPELEDVLAADEAKKNEGQPTPEELYGMIDEMTPVDGVYKIWSPKGVQNMADHPDATFEFLCSIDMQGATLRPIGTKDQPFTGNIRGLNCILSNFTISESVDGCLGFIGVNQGKISDFYMEEVTIIADENTKYIGGIAAYSDVDVSRASVKGTINVEKAADGAVCGGVVGYTKAQIINCVSDMDITYTASGSATIGGCMGIGEGTHAEFTENYGSLVVTGSNKTVGLIAGKAKDCSFYSVAFLGEQNEVDGKLVSTRFGVEENVTLEKLLVRDNTPRPLPENIQKLRQTVVDAMYEMATIRWTTTENLYHDCHCQLAICHGIYKPGMLHIGIPYNHYSTTLTRFKACLTEDGLVKDWLYPMPSVEGFDTYFGNDCSGAVQAAWWTVSNSTDVRYCENMQPIRSQYGCIAVGGWPSDVVDVPAGKDSKDLITPLMELNDWFEVYAQVRMGDAYVHIGENGNHTRMAQEDPVIVRDENGLIDGDYSYIVTVEQGAPAVVDPYFCTWRYDYKYTFKNLIMAGYFPVTCEELLTGEMEPVECKATGIIEGKGGMTVGTVEANYNIDTVTLTITDSDGNVAFQHVLNPNASYRSDWGATDMGIRNVSMHFELPKFATPLADANLKRGEAYEYQITALLSTTDQIVVHEGSFVNGSAA